ncbi:hypothetical protein [Staphylococcus hominis]|uniref:hypothetical protein n=1 Tax=Staphylococcus hominis TaxID=1290 RepID=UPI00115D36C6|nr:hypothetical protein [Staphylococcus hominis]
MAPTPAFVERWVSQETLFAVAPTPAFVERWVSQETLFAVAPTPAFVERWVSQETLFAEAPIQISLNIAFFTKISMLVFLKIALRQHVFDSINKY